ncbi:MAG: sugar phosphate nucleotidyltransferase [Candidatus Woesearchaeota archaeon]
MKLIIPMAGKGTRLRPHTWSKPKPLLKVAGKPVLHHIIDRIARDIEIDEAIFIISGMEDQIRSAVSSFNFKKTFYHQEHLNGDAGAIIKARDDVIGEAMIVFSDTVFDADIENISSIMTDGIVWVKEVEDPRSFGVVEVQNNIIKDVVEKPKVPPSNLAIIGLYYFKDMTKVFEAIEYLFANNITTKDEYRLADALSLMIKDGMKLSIREVSKWLDCGTPENLLNTNRTLLQMNGSLCSSPDTMISSVIRDHVWVGEDTKLENCVIGENVSIGRNVTVKNSVISNSIIDDNVIIENMIMIDSLVGENATVKAQQRKVNMGDHSFIRL